MTAEEKKAVPKAQQQNRYSQIVEIKVYKSVRAVRLITIACRKQSAEQDHVHICAVRGTIPF
ncbi:hypothetical protein T4C_13625 [Trichinella pseudospiralis]|uniref:Uncharacterized protein n=1 Tax=Trichinella pseudospiralis TaxID=6337 RepID=A0A0V0XGC1_TRIPS|nr:hypothetical protein T4E_9795 [Trichinella pseudospiralis]KRX87082.1 hypothetical protein T4E_10147 [Trichinella pseudospiralis]KRZ32375.1 hypothetical protein T4C_13625 [Trichinella pseudospiralis]